MAERQVTEVVPSTVILCETRACHKDGMYLPLSMKGGVIDKNTLHLRTRRVVLIHELCILRR